MNENWKNWQLEVSPNDGKNDENWKIWPLEVSPDEK